MQDHQERRANRLSRESSPYLLQHAHNPVDWYPWGPEAFAAARERDVPIFLSVGYSTCYWCHVMERESFESDSIARLMNERFVNIKVDREERPDVDDVYMAATQVLSGRGGWPMSCFLEPEGLKPFWCGTYFPPVPRQGMPGFGQVLESISSAWRQKRAEVVEQAVKVAEVVAEHVGARMAPVGIGLEQVTQAAQGLLQALDRTWGGFGGAPKFPQAANLEFLLDVRESAGDEGTRRAMDEAIRLTLDKMAIGGLRDQVGGGFHRYSVDQMWTVPHFEKMLYDNAQLISVYARAAAMYGDEFYRRVVESTIGYVRAEMTAEAGGFFSAQDAEVDGREGANYVWTEAEVKAALEGEDAEFATRVYGLERGANFRDPHHADALPVNVLRMEDRPERIAAAMGMDEGTFVERLGRVNANLLRARALRKQPRLDDKVLASWNGMMVAALADAGRLLGKQEWVSMAARGASFVLERMRGCDGLMRVEREGKVSTPAFLEDYAYVVAGLLSLSRAEGETGGDLPRLRTALDLIEEAEGLFGDAAGGGYFDTRAGADELFVRPRMTHDGAMPSGSSVMLNNLVDAFRATGDARLLERAVRCAGALSHAVAASPVSSINATRGVLRLLALGQKEKLAALGPPAPAGEAARQRDFTPVEVYADAERITVSADAPAQLRIVLRIAEGYHITAAEPGPAAMGLLPLRVGVINGSGVAAYADYPAGEAYGEGGELRIYRGEVELPVVVEMQGEWKGRPLLAVRFQACTETECLEPVTVELDVAIDRG